LLDNFEGFKNPVPEVTENVVEMARQLKLEVEPQDIAELMGSHSQPLSSEYFWHLKNRQEDVPQEVPIIEPKGLTSKIPYKVFCYFKAGMTLLEKHDLDFETSSKVSANLVGDYACYTE
jgi:hypothetical protein